MATNPSYSIPQLEEEQKEREREILNGRPETATLKEDPAQQPQSGNTTTTTEREVRYNTDYPFAPIVGPEFFENKKKQEEELFKQRAKREKGRMTAGALADTIRLIGHGTAINRGANETQWGENKNVQHGIKAINKYRDEYANALRNIEDAEMQNNLAGKEFNYREFLRKHKEGRQDEQRAEAQDWREKQYDDSQDWREGQFEYKKKRDEEADRKWRLNHELNKERVANSRWYNQNRVKAKDEEDDLSFPFRYQGNEYNIDLADKKHKAGMAEMANSYLSRLEQQRDNYDAAAWRKIENSDIYQAIKRLSNYEWPEDFAPINTILPDFFDPKIAEEYGIPYNQLQGEQAPVNGPTREDRERLDPDLKSDVIRTLERQRQEKEGNQPVNGPEQGQVSTPQQSQQAPPEQEADTANVFPEQNVRNLKGKQFDELRPIERQNLIETDWQGFDPRQDQDAMRLKRDVFIDRFMKSSEADPGTEDKLNEAAIEMYNYLRYAKPQQLVNQYGNVTEEQAIQTLKEILQESKQ